MNERQAAMRLGVDQKLFMTQQELAKTLGVSKSTICRWVDAGALPVVTVGKNRFIRRDLIWDWLDEHTHVPVAPVKEGT